MDILYPLGEGSICDNLEIRYSLRSVQKYLKGYRNIYIIGVLPDFLKGVIHIPYDDISVDKETNIFRKILRACQERDLSDNFLFMNDDHFFVKSMDCYNFPYFYKGDILTSVQKLPNANKYKRNLQKTMTTLHSRGYSTKNFDTHTPIVYNKNRFIDTMNQYDWGTRVGYTIKSTYCNTLGIEGIKEADCKIGPSGEYWTADDILDKIKDAHVFSVSNRTIRGNGGKVALQYLYPDPSPWEA